MVRFGVLFVSNDAGLRRHDGIGEQVALTRTSTARGLGAGGKEDKSWMPACAGMTGFLAAVVRFGVLLVSGDAGLCRHDGFKVCGYFCN